MLLFACMQAVWVRATSDAQGSEEEEEETGRIISYRDKCSSSYKQPGWPFGVFCCLSILKKSKVSLLTIVLITGLPVASIVTATAVTTVIHPYNTLLIVGFC